jgi:hypothetical protein
MAGLGSIFFARPSRMRTLMPQPAAHRPHTVLYQVATRTALWRDDANELLDRALVGF